MQRIITLKRQSNDLFVLKIENQGAVDDEDGHKRTYFLNKEEIESLTRKCLASLTPMANEISKIMPDNSELISDKMSNI